MFGDYSIFQFEELFQVIRKFLGLLGPISFEDYGYQKSFVDIYAANFTS